MHLENEPIEKSKELVKTIFRKLLEDVDLIPSNCDKPYVYLIGIAIWDIFSNNHDVVSADNKIFYIGSWRGSGSTISEVINHNFKTNESYGYLDFYMGSFYQIDDAVSLKEIYKAIFAHLKDTGCDWFYAYPRMYAIDLNQNKQESTQDNLLYDSNIALENEMKNKERKEKMKAFQDQLDDDFKKRKEKMKKEPLPDIIQAFKSIYNYLPTGWKG